MLYLIVNRFTSKSDDVEGQKEYMNAFAMSAVILVTVIVKGLLTLRDECFRSKH